MILAKSPKYYVVWIGRKPGIYADWASAQSQIKGHADAKFKSFDTLAEAETAFRYDWSHYYKPQAPRTAVPKASLSGNVVDRLSPELLSEIVTNSVAVDAACSGNPGKMEYRGVYTMSPETELFRSPVFPLGTNNIGEFLALVHALALFSKTQPDLTIYSDSVLAMGWIKKRKCSTKLPLNSKTEKLHDLIQRGEKWLRANTWQNPILKWQTDRWGEIPADFGRK